MANDIFSMGYVMCLFSNHWFKRLIVFFAFLSLSTFSYSKELWSSVGYWYYKRDLGNDNAISQTDCDLSKFSGAKKTDGNPNAPRVDVKTKIDSSGIVTDYGDGEKPFLGDGIFRYAEKIEFSKNLSKGQGDTGSQALRTALQKGNCDIVESLLDAMVNGELKTGPNGDNYLGFQNGDDKCVISSNGTSLCNVSGSAEQCDDNGENCHIVVGNDKEMTLDDYSKTPKKDRIPRNSNPSNSGSDSGNSSGSSGSSSSGSGSGNSSGSSSTGGTTNSGDNPSQGNNQGGTNVGSGSGNGEGDGEGDGNSDFDKPGLDEFDLKSAFSGLKDSLKDLIPELSMPAGNCPTVSIPVFNTTKNINVHCQIFDQNGGKLTAVFSLIWGFLAIRILLSA
ncbi:hypothetical protein ACFGYS_04625 [Pasteurella multocida]